MLPSLSFTWASEQLLEKRSNDNFSSFSVSAQVSAQIKMSNDTLTHIYLCVVTFGLSKITLFHAKIKWPFSTNELGNNVLPGPGGAVHAILGKIARLTGFTHCVTSAGTFKKDRSEIIRHSPTSSKKRSLIQLEWSVCVCHWPVM